MPTISSLLRRHRGFTLVELIIVIAIIAIIAAVVFVAIDPAKRLNTSRNSRRWSDMGAVIDAIKLYRADNGGALPSNLAGIAVSTARIIGTTAFTDAQCAAYTCAGVTVPGTSCGVNITSDLSTYLKKIPFDPNGGTVGDTKYFVSKDANGFLTVGACSEQGEGAGGTGTAPTIELSE